MEGPTFHEVAAGFPDPFRLLIRESVASTNDEVRNLANAGAADGLTLLTEQQTAGRGRRGAAWFTEPGESLAFSILCRPTESKSLWPRLALAAGIAVAEAVEAHGLDAGIKWPNDIWISGKKAAGILVEAGPDFAVVGIGLNVNPSIFPPEVSAIATSMRIQGERDFSRAEVLGDIIRRFSIRRHQIDQDFPELLRALSTRCVLTGQQVTLLTPTGMKEGRVEGIGGGGELLLRTTMGLEALIQADEVRLTSR